MWLYCTFIGFCFGVSVDSERADDTFSNEGLTFQVGGVEDGAETSPSNPNCFAWCLMNLCISKLVQQVVRRMVAGVGLEVLGKYNVCTTHTHTHIHVHMYMHVYVCACMYMHACICVCMHV